VSFLSSLGQFSLKRKKSIIIGWGVITLIACLGAAQITKVLRVGGFDIPGTEFNAATAILDRELNISSYKTLLVVYHSENLKISSTDYYSAMRSSLDSLKTDPLVESTETFYDTGIPDMVGSDMRTTYAIIHLKGTEDELEKATPRFRKLVRSDILSTYVTGQPAVNFDIEKISTTDLITVDAFSMPLVFIILLIYLRSATAAAIPFVVGGISIVLSLGAMFVLASFADVSIFAMNVSTMIGFGLAVDFSLLLLQRYREELSRGSAEHALQVTMETAGRSVCISGTTLMLTLLVLTLFPVMIIRSIAQAIVFTSFVAVLASLLLVPSILLLFHDKLRTAPVKNATESAPRLLSYLNIVLTRPGIAALAAIALLAIFAYPSLHMYRIGTNASVLPAEVESRHAVDLIKEKFGIGESSPIQVVVKGTTPGSVWDQHVLTGLYKLHTRLSDDPRVQRVRSLVSSVQNPSLEKIQSLSPAVLEKREHWYRVAKRFVNLHKANDTQLLLVFPENEETTPQTIALLEDIRKNARQWAPELSGMEIYVGGSPAQQYDFDKVVYGNVPVLATLSLIVTFVAFLVFFRSLVIPFTAIIMSIGSIFASYGLMVLVFQDGYGASFLNVESLGGLQTYTPIVLFSIIFGLSTDYEVFLLSRVKEFHEQGYSTAESIQNGIVKTFNIVTIAGLIMVVVFGSILFTQVLVMKEIGFALALAILVDITIVRMLLLPASMKLLGKWNWWLPGGRRLIPQMSE
jgi:RND superfamily putative drug exporter